MRVLRYQTSDGQQILQVTLQNVSALFYNLPLQITKRLVQPILVRL